MKRRERSVRKQRNARRLKSEMLEDRLLMTFDFRSIDGIGNNEANGREDWGAAETQLIRNGYPGGYPDGYGDVIRTAPNPRDVSNAVHAQSASVLNDRNLSDWVVQWGQFITHDMDLTSNSTAFDELFSGGTGDFSIPVNDANDPLGPNPIPFIDLTTIPIRVTRTSFRSRHHPVVPRRPHVPIGENRSIRLLLSSMLPTSTDLTKCGPTRCEPLPMES
jgi:hypothetical protein